MREDKRPIMADVNLPKVDASTHFFKTNVGIEIPKKSILPTARVSYQEIQDAVLTLVHVIAKNFVGTNHNYQYLADNYLQNLQCPKLQDLR